MLAKVPASFLVILLAAVVPRLSWDGMVYFMIPWPSLLIVFAKYVSLLDLPFSVTTTYLDTSRRPKKGGLLYILYTLYKAPVRAHKSNP